MAQIHSVVLVLLSPILASPAASMAEAAIAQINAVTRDLGDLTSKEQLEVADRVVAGALRRELRLIDENREMRISLSETGDLLLGQQRQRRDDRLVVNSIKVLRELSDGQYREEDLISGQRRQAVLQLFHAWSTGVAEARRQLDIGDDDSR